MKPLKTTLLTMLLVAVSGYCAHSRHVNLVVDPEADPAKDADTLTIADDEVAEVVSYVGPGRLTVTTQGVEVGKKLESVQGVPTFWSPATEPFIVAGPAEIRLIAITDDSAICTVKVTPESFPPGKTLAIPAGTGTAEVTLESSSDLKHWEPTEPGTFGDIEENLFFRIRAEGVE